MQPHSSAASRHNLWKGPTSEGEYARTRIFSSAVANKGRKVAVPAWHTPAVIAGVSDRGNGPVVGRTPTDYPCPFKRPTCPAFNWPGTIFPIMRQSEGVGTQKVLWPPPCCERAIVGTCFHKEHVSSVSAKRAATTAPLEPPPTTTISASNGFECGSCCVMCYVLFREELAD